jgi:mannose-6-phosphate isomerase-like protein (cupin superfamily)
MKQLFALGAVAAVWLVAADRSVDPTFLHRSLDQAPPTASDLSTGTCRYKALFGAGDPDSRIARGVARYGELSVDAGGASALVARPAEEQAWVILEGSGSVIYGDEQFPVKRHDFFYIPPDTRHGIKAATALRAMVMGFKIPAAARVVKPAKFQIANFDEVKKQVVGGHPPSTLYQLMMGDTKSTRDRLSTGHVITSLFVMEFDAGGTNFPHHHDREEEIYYVLNGHGEMVAGSGMDGVEGRFPAKAGDAYFFRLNATVGFYAKQKAGEEKSRVLAIRSLYPFGGNR